jgi:hypothetical protein
MVFREEPRKQKPRSCRAQEFGRSSAQEKQWLEKDALNSVRVVLSVEPLSYRKAKKFEVVIPVPPLLHDESTRGWTTSQRIDLWPGPAIQLGERF